MMDELSEKLLKEVERSYSESGKITDDLLSALNCIFHGPLLSALELVDKTSVTKYTSPSGRKLFQRMLGDVFRYLEHQVPPTCVFPMLIIVLVLLTIFQAVRHCADDTILKYTVVTETCEHYLTGPIDQIVLKKEEHIMCKHVLAMRLSEAMGQCKKLNVTNEEMTSMILAME